METSLSAENLSIVLILQKLGIVPPPRLRSQPGGPGATVRAIMGGAFIWGEVAGLIILGS